MQVNVTRVICQLFFFSEQETGVPFAERRESVNLRQGPSQQMCVQLLCHKLDKLNVSERIFLNEALQAAFKSE